MGVTSKTCLLHHKLDQYQQASLCLQGLQTPLSLKQHCTLGFFQIMLPSSMLTWTPNTLEKEKEK